MIVIKSSREIDLMRKAGKITAAARALARDMVRPGVSTGEIDKAVYDLIVKNGATPSFLNYSGFPASACISVNEEVIHGIPGKRVLQEGDIVSLDLGACYQGYHGDCADTFPVGQVSDEAKRLIEATRQSFFEGMKFARHGNRVADISRAIQTYAESQGFSIVRDYVGHGLGAKLHEEPEIPNYVSRRANPRLMKGMTIAVEPMVNAGTWRVQVLDDGWTVVTADGALSAHYENSVLITDGEPEILTVEE